MDSRRLGCLTGSGLASLLITLFLLAGVAFASGGQMFSAGSLNAAQGTLLGNVTSHSEIAECGACHAAPWSGDRMADRCMNCHVNIPSQLADPASIHGALYQSNPAFNCRACHPEHRGKSADLTDTKDIDFPHDAMGYFMTGHHAKSDGSEFACVDCHPTDLGTFEPAVCLECHNQIDPAYTKAHMLSFGEDCIACHDGADRYGSEFTHAAFKFQLNGKHESVSCTKCHLDARSVADLQSTPQECRECHDDEHQARFGTNCADCHTVEGWSPAKFNHDLADFQLTGSHLEAACENCHPSRPYRGTPKECISCHQDKDEHEGRFGTDCAICHNTSTWEEVNVDHNIFAFPLTGKHIDVDCEKCHTDANIKETPSDCYSCHKQIDAHKGDYGIACELCHNTSDWKDAKFDHSGFPLTLGHKGVACLNCHSKGVFDGLSTACVSCHGDPGYHAGLFGTTCDQCHTTRNWSASYNGPHPGISDEGGSGVNHGGASCSDCHTSTLHTATCGNCHDGNEGGEGGGGDDD